MVSSFSSSCLVLALVLSYHGCCLVEAFGLTGHIVAAEIAQSLIPPTTLSYLTTLLPLDEGQISSPSVWAEIILLNRPETAPFHYIDTPYIWTLLLTPPATCPVCESINLCTLEIETEAAPCLYSALVSYSAQINDETLTALQRHEALKFLLHLVIDAHNPLHTGYTDDNGGFLTRVQVGGGGRSSGITDLHTIWETVMIDQRVQEYTSNDTTGIPPFDLWTQSLLANASFKDDEDDVLVFCNPTSECPPLLPQLEVFYEKWIIETFSIMQETVYLASPHNWIVPNASITTPRFVFTSDYYQANIAVVEQQILKAGFRLAFVLNGLAEQQAQQNAATTSPSQWSPLNIVMVVLIIFCVACCFIIMCVNCEVCEPLRTYLSKFRSSIDTTTTTPVEAFVPPPVPTASEEYNESSRTTNSFVLDEHVEMIGLDGGVNVPYVDSSTSAI